MSPIPLALRQFIDLEARVGNGDSSEEEGEATGLDNFIDDEDTSVPHVRWGDISGGHNALGDDDLRDDDLGDDDSDDGLSGVLARIWQRYDSRRQPPPTGNDARGVPSSVDQNVRPPAQSDDDFLKVEDEDALDRLGRMPRLGDYPLWRVRCRAGLEEEVVFFVLQRVAPEHELRSAFTRGSIRGWVYLEATMNEPLTRLLKRAPGIIRLQTGVSRQQIDFKDWKEVLTMQDIRTRVAVGDWVRVCKGTYKGDVGYVYVFANWGGVFLLLVPRLLPPRPPGSPPTKRKRSGSRPEPMLFDPTIYGARAIDPTERDETVYDYNGYKFENGLILKSFDIHSISLDSVYMPTYLFDLFQQSHHPTLLASTFPRPLEWNFDEFERVVLCSTGKEGVVSKTGANFVEVDLATGEGTINVRWLDIRKYIVEGDFVEVTSGLLRGQTGWVECVKDETVHIIQHIVGIGMPDDPTSLSNVKKFEVHVNWLKVTGPPSSYGSQPVGSTHLKSDPVPWVGTTVVMSKVGNAMKGYKGVVKSVLCGQGTPSGLRLVVQLTHLDPSAPFKTVIVDYDHVLELSRGCKLFDFSEPTSKLFKPCNHAPAPPRLRQPPTGPTRGDATPMPDWPPSSTPAWNPSSRTPVPDPEPTPGPSRRCRTPELEHPLLDSRLAGMQFKVLVTGGSFKKKEMVASVISVDGQLSLRHTSYNTSASLRPEWVTPKHPHPTRDNGPLVVIGGEHCGKCVRRIHHRYENEKAILILAVVTRVAGVAASLAGEQLELDVSQLCLGIETPEEKKQNDSLMTSLREEARKTRAK